MAEQFLGSLERQWQHRAVLDYAVGPGCIVVHDKAATDRVVLAAANLQPGSVEGAEDHAVGMVRQRFANHRQVLLFNERDAVFA